MALCHKRLYDDFNKLPLSDF
uniref:Uncharacterized protein n=1 Tax=Arundo donax TaxID=35708 RepID=A0A0A9HQU0_ARUDO